MRPSGSSRKLAVLWTLYFVQGLPFGFQATALPVYLRTAGVSLSAIGFATALALPWMLKVLWSPLVDRYGSERFGRRRSWIAPMQLALALTCASAAFLPPGEGLAVLLTLVFLMNLFAATMDIAVDGLAVDFLEIHELGQGNVAQVVGYKAGMLTGGGLLVWASGWIGWRGLFLSMAGLIAVAMIVTLTYREPSLRGSMPGPSRQSLRRVFELLTESVRVPGAGWVLLFIGTYKLGESMADTMFKPFLVDSGFAREQIGLWVGTWGMGFSIVGSIAGGVLASRIPLIRAVAITASLRALAVGAEWWLAWVTPTDSRVIAVTCIEHLFGGAVTTAMFAWMMSRVDKRIGATHYTLFASVEVWGKLPPAWVSGIIVDATSYVSLFGVSTVLSLLFLGLLWPLRERMLARVGAMP